MTPTPATAARGLGFPAIDLRTTATVLVAGCVAAIAFDVFGQALATRVWGVVFGEGYRPGGHLLHYVAGLLAYPIGWMFTWRPLAQRALRRGATGRR